MIFLNGVWHSTCIYPSYGRKKRGTFWMRKYTLQSQTMLSVGQSCDALLSAAKLNTERRLEGKLDGVAFKVKFPAT